MVIVTKYLVEAYASRAAATSDLERRARAAAVDLAATGTLIRHVTSILVPEDEICFHLFEADSIESVRLASDRADIVPQRIVEASS
jgi:hypothetical protein